MAKVDYEDVFGSIQWDLDKAKFLLFDLRTYFDSPDLEYPTREKVEAIRDEYKRIAVIAGLLSDIVEKLENTIEPLL